MDYWRVLVLFLIIHATSVNECSSSLTTQNGDIGEDDSSFQQSTADHRSHAHMYSQSQQAEDNYAGSIDEFCDGLETGSIRSSAILRLNFAGRFLAYTASYNNYWQNYNIHTFDPLKDPGWNPQGSNDFRLVNCTVTQVCYEDGTCATKRPVCPEDGECVQKPDEDFIVGQPIIGSDSTNAGKIVDLDPEKGPSQLWGLMVGVDGFFKGDFVPRGFTHKRNDACVGPDCDTVNKDTTHSAVWVSTLENVTWAFDLTTSQSDFVQQVMSLRCKPGFKLYVKLNVYNMIVDPKSPDYAYGRVVGTIYAVVSNQETDPLPYGPYKRMLWSPDGGHVPFYVDDHTKKVVMDFANNVKFYVNGSMVEPSGGHLYLIQYKDKIQGSETEYFGEIEIARSNELFKRNAGIVELLVEDTIETIKSTPLAVIHKKIAMACKTTDSECEKECAIVCVKACETVLKERQDGLYVEAIDNREMRMEPNSDWTPRFRTFQLGSPAEGIEIGIRQTWPKPDNSNPISYEDPEPSDETGISTITFKTSDPGKPREEEQLDGQVYEYEIMAMEGTSEAEQDQVQDLTLTIHLYSEYTPPDEVTWYKDVYPIFQQYANLSPVMKPIINLASYEDVIRKKKLLKHAFNLPEEHPNYMPVTRDLSPKKREMINNWLDNLDASSNLPLLDTTTHNLDDIDTATNELKKTLQVALQLELTTIPPYVSALFSIKHGENREVAALIKSVVIDEMKHMALVSNILNAIGGAPNLKNQAIVPSYPAPLPAGANPGLEVKLARCSLHQIRTVFQGIERPGCEIADSAVSRYLRVHRKTLMKYYCKGASEGPDNTDDTDDTDGSSWEGVLSEISKRCSETTASPQTIGAIYIHQILCPMVMLEAKESGGTLFTGDSTKQITSAQWIGSDGSSPYPVHDLRSAVCAILDIATEGEGSDPCDPFDARDELSHFFKFAEVVHGRRLMETDPDATLGHTVDDFLPCDEYMKCDKTFSFIGRLVYFSQDGVWPTISNPHTERYPPGSLVRKYSDNFNTIYTGLLNCMHEAFNGHPEKMKEDCMGMMSSLTVWAKKLVRTPIDPKGDPEIGPNAAPTFEFHDPTDKDTL
ncbi:uncharacterized protein [Branchiostoma lanceolatum]|uniref:uncharacterized protein n=1 Tax=Branchiostoma lanceolatum TaxID=7740 RepID=UPI0034525212